MRNVLSIAIELGTSSHSTPGDESEHTRSKEPQGPTGAAHHKTQGAIGRISFTPCTIFNLMCAARAMNLHPKEGDGRDRSRGERSQQPLDAPPYEDIGTLLGFLICTVQFVYVLSAAPSRKKGKEVDRSRGKSLPAPQAGKLQTIHFLLYVIRLLNFQSIGEARIRRNVTERIPRKAGRRRSPLARRIIEKQVSLLTDYFLSQCNVRSVLRASRAKGGEGRDHVELRVAKRPAGISAWRWR